MNEDWPVVRLDEVTRFASGVAFPQSQQGRSEGEFPFLKVSDMNLPENVTAMVAATNWISEEQRKSLKATLHPAGTVIFPKVGAALKTEKRRILTRPSAFDNNVMGLVPGDDLLPQFLLAFMSTVQLGALCQDGVVPSVNQSIVGGVRLRLPPKSEQRRIADLAGAIGDDVAARRRLVEGARNLKAALIDKLMSPRDHWLESTLGDMATVLSGGTPSTSKPEFWGGDVLWATPSDVTALPTRFIRDTARKITSKGLKESSARLVPRGSVLVTSRATIGATAIAAAEIAVNQGITALVTGPSTDRDWLFYWVAYAKDEMLARASGTTFLEISRTKMKALPLRLPPLEEQARAAAVLTAIDDEIEAACESLRCTERLATQLRHSLVLGEITLAQSYDRFLHSGHDTLSPRPDLAFA